MNIEALIVSQRAFFRTGETKELSFRMQQLERLKAAVQRYERPIIEALAADLGKSEFEAYATEVGFVLESISSMLKNMKRWTAPKKVKTPIWQAPSKSYIMYEPYGVVAIIGPFNYPFQLLLEPLIGAIASGNTVILKPSELTPAVERVVTALIDETFKEDYVAVVCGEKDVTSTLIHAPVDYIFFTGSVPVGKIVMKAAAERLVPVTLELGGKSPTIVDRTANIDVAATRIAWGKWMNVGQTCIAPDYVYVHEDVKDAFVAALRTTLEQFYGANAQVSPDYGRIVNERHFDRLTSLIDETKVVIGGTHDRADRYIAPTVMTDVTWEDAVMKDEIFGPILPILTYSSLDDVIATIEAEPKPLALYVFSEANDVQQRVLNSVSFGSGCVNDTISQVSNPDLPFGGVGPSGIGRYHGKYSIETFSHHKAILQKPTWFNVKLIFPPYAGKLSLVKKLLK